MSIHLIDRACLRPRCARRATRRAPPTRHADRPAEGSTARRVDGVLRLASQPQRPLIVATIDYDGQQCRYRIVDADGRANEWITEQPGDEYVSCARSIVAALRMLGRDESVQASVVDSLLGPDGQLWIAIRDVARRRSRWVAVPQAR